MSRPVEDIIDFDLRKLLDHELTTTDLIAPAIERLRTSTSFKRPGASQFSVSLCPSLDHGEACETQVCFRWRVDALQEAGCPRLQDDLAKLRRTKAPGVVTELAALAVTFGLVTCLLPMERIWHVAIRGASGDFYLNGRYNEMIEISGTQTESLSSRFAAKRRQVLKNSALVKAFVCVVQFKSRTARLERVK